MRLIDADKAIMAIEQHRIAVLEGHKWDEGIEYGYAAAHRHLVDIIEQLPSVQPERKTGRWIESNPQDSKLCRFMTCSECGKAYIVNINVPYEDWTEAHKFCVECGADMRGEQNG